MKVSLKTFLSSSIFIGMLAFCSLSFVAIYFAAQDGISKNFEDKMAGIGEVASALSSIDELNEILKLDSESAKISPLFLKYHTSLLRTSKETGAEFVYIFKYGGKKDLLYIVDASDMESPDWCAPNVAEDSVDEDLKEGLLHAFRGTGGVSEMVDTNEWGFMRSGTYPINNSEERSLYMTGVDVKLGEIASRMASTMTQAAFVFVIISALSVFAASVFAGKISKPLARVKNEILKMESGEKFELLDGNTLPRLNEIAQTVAKYSLETKEKITNLKSAAEKISRESLSGILREALKPSDCAFDFIFTDIENSKKYCGAALCGKNFYAWSFNKSENEISDILKNSAIVSVLRRSPNFSEELKKLCIDFSEFSSDAKSIFSFGEQIEMNVFRNGEEMEIEFKFACGASVKGAKNELY